MKHKMKEKDAILIAGVLGVLVMALLFRVWSPMIWGTDPGATGGAVSDNGTSSGVSPSGVWAETASEGGVSAAGTGSGNSAVSGAAASAPGQTVLATGIVTDPSGKTLETRFSTPSGYERTEEGGDSFASYVRNYPLKKDGSKVKLYNKKRKDNQDAHIAVFKLPIENEDLQQCADSVIRMYAEYFYATGQFERISFRLADGFQADYTRWREGFRFQPGSAGTIWVGGSEPYDGSYENFKKYIRMVFAYAGTVSMIQETKKTSLKKLQVGDVFIQSGSPGHVVMVADVCENAEGKKAFLLAQGYMPAQQFHLLKNPAHEDDPWYYAEEVSYPFETPEYTFRKGSLRHLEY